MGLCDHRFHSHFGKDLNVRRAIMMRGYASKFQVKVDPKVERERRIKDVKRTTLIERNDHEIRGA
jgi:hypothetical protein